MKVKVEKKGVKPTGSNKEYPIGKVFACTKEFAEPFIKSGKLREVSEKELTDSEKEFYKGIDKEGENN